MLLLLSDDVVSFLGLSANFIGLNGILIIIIIFLGSASEGGTFLDIINRLKEKCPNADYVDLMKPLRSVLAK